MARRLVLLALLLLPLAYVPAHASAALGEGAGPALHDYRPAILPVTATPPERLGVLAANTCADGILVHDEAGGAAGVVLPNLQVQLWGQGSLRDTDLTDASGGFTLCTATDVTLDLHVRVVTENGFWRVQNGEAYRFDLTVATGVAPGATHHYGQIKPGAGTPEAGALQIFNSVDRLWSWTAAQHANDCWDALDHKPPDGYAACRQLSIDWHPDSATRAFYDSALNRVHLAGVDHKWRDAVVREAAKAVMDDLFDEDFPDTQDCGPGTDIGKQTTANCAWVNGFADWVAVQVFAEPVLDWQVGTQIFHVDLEAPGWDTPGWDPGDAVEGRVAGALLDLSDSTNEAPWDRFALGANAVWLTLLNHSWSQRFRTLADIPFGGDTVLSTLYQNTIDYGLRDPLAAGTLYNRRTPAPPQNFRFTTTLQRWSVMAIRPPAGTDYDLRLFATADLAGTPIATSTFGASTPDLVVVDSNPGKRPLGTFYPQVYQYSGDGAYDLRFAQSASTILIGGSVNAGMSAANPVAVWETAVAANASVRLDVTQPAGLNAELLLFCSTTAASTWVRGRPLATAVAPQLASGTETLTWTAPATAPGDCAVVLTNKSGSGTYTVTRVS